MFVVYFLKFNNIICVALFSTSGQSIFLLNIKKSLNLKFVFQQSIIKVGSFGSLLPAHAQTRPEAHYANPRNNNNSVKRNTGGGNSHKTSRGLRWREGKRRGGAKDAQYGHTQSTRRREGYSRQTIGQRRVRLCASWVAQKGRGMEVWRMDEWNRTVSGHESCFSS